MKMREDKVKSKDKDSGMNPKKARREQTPKPVKYDVDGPGVPHHKMIQKKRAEG